MKLSSPTPEVVYIPALFRRISQGEIKIPAFQREFVWTQKQILELLRSIHRGYPIGSLLFWNIRNYSIKTVDKNFVPFPDIISDSPVYVLDGMQRVSTLYSVFHYDEQWGEEFKRFNIYYNIDIDDFVPYEEGIESGPYISLNKIFNPRSLFAEQARIAAISRQRADEYIEKSLKLLSTFQEYLVPTVTISNRDIQEVVEIFERINSTGTTLNVVDFVRAITWTQGFDLTTEINRIRLNLKDVSFDWTDETIIKAIAIIAGRQPSSEAIITLRDIDRGDLKKYSLAAEEYFMRIRNLFAEREKILSSDFIPYEGQVLYFIKMLAVENEPSEKLLQSVFKWFWATSMNESLRGRPDPYLIRYLNQLESAIETKEYVAVEEGLVSSGIELRERQLSAKAALSQVVYSMFAKNSARSLINGEIIDYAEYMDEFDSKNLVALIESPQKVNRLRPNKSPKVLSNLVLMTRNDRREATKKGMSPTDVIYRLIGSKEGENILESQFIRTLDLKFLEKEPALFLIERARYMRNRFQRLSGLQRGTVRNRL